MIRQSKVGGITYCERSSVERLEVDCAKGVRAQDLPSPCDRSNRLTGSWSRKGSSRCQPRSHCPADCDSVPQVQSHSTLSGTRLLHTGAVRWRRHETGRL
jgi:hypothetical protein